MVGMWLSTRQRAHARTQPSGIYKARTETGQWLVGCQRGWTDAPGQYNPRDWVEFINSNVSHLGERRLRDLQWPVPKDEERLTHIAKFVLERLKSVSQGSDPRAVVIHTLSQRGLRYLDDPTEENLAKIARAIDGPL
jgi:hypothetical protein